MKLKEALPDFEDYIQKGYSEEQIIKIAKQKMNEKAKNTQTTSTPSTQPVKQDFKQKARKWILNSDDTSAKIMRGATQGFLNLVDLTDGAMGIVDPHRQNTAEEKAKRAKRQEIKQKLEAKKEQTIYANASEERKKELKELKEQMANAKGAWGSTKATAKYLYDTVTHPSEITLQGATEFGADPLNLVPFGAGAKVANFASKPLLKIALGTGVGSAEMAGVNAGVAYTQAKGSGADETEAKKQAKNAAVMGAFMGGAFGAIGGGLSKSNQKALAKLKQNKEVKGIEKSNEALNVEAELRAKVSDEVVKTDASKSLKVTAEDMHISKTINDGVEVKPEYSGYHVVTKIKNSIDAGHDVEYARAKLSEAGYKGEALQKAVLAVEKKDSDIFVDFITDKQKKANDGYAELEKIVRAEQDKIKGDGFVADKPSKTIYADNANISIDEALEKEFLHNNNPTVTSIAWLYEKHPEMFKSKTDVYKTIQLVKNNPDMITKAKSKDGVYLAKALDDRKMGDIVIHKGEEQNKIIHANKKRIKEFKEGNSEDPLTLHTSVKRTGELDANILDSKSRLLPLETSLAKSGLKKDKSFLAKALDRFSEPIKKEKLTKQSYLKEFGLKSLDDDFVANTDYLKAIGIHDKVVLKKGALKKLLNRGREDLYKQIRPTLENPNAVIKHDGALLFIKSFVDKKGKKHFMSVAKKFDNDNFTVSSNSLREQNNILNKLNDGEIIYVKEGVHLPSNNEAGQIAKANPLASNAHLNEVSRPLDNSLANKGLKDDKAIQKEKRGIYNVSFNEKKSTQIRNSDLKDIVKYEKGNRKYGAKHILRKHLGDGKTGELTKKDILSFGEVIRHGKIDVDSFRKTENGISYTYILTKKDKMLKVAVEQTDDGKKILSGFSDKNFVNHNEGGITLDQPPLETSLAKSGLKKDKSFLAKALDSFSEPMRKEKLTKQSYLKEFGLKSLDDDFVANTDYLKTVGVDDKIVLKKGALSKLFYKGRERTYKLIRPTLENPNAVIKHDGALLFAKSFTDDAGQKHFMSVAKKFDSDNFTVSSNSLREQNNILNKLNDGEMIYVKGDLKLQPEGSKQIAKANSLASSSNLNEVSRPLKNSLANKSLKDDKSVTLHGGIAQPIVDAVIKPFKLLQQKSLDALDNFGKIKTEVKTVKVEKVSLKSIKNITGSKPKVGIYEATKEGLKKLSLEEFKLIDGKDRKVFYEVVKNSRGKKEAYLLGLREVMKENSFTNMAKNGLFDNLHEDFVKQIHLKAAHEANTAKRIKGYEEALRKLSDEDSKAFVQALDGELDKLPKGMQESYKGFREVIDARANMLVQLGMAKKEDIIKDYVKRLYLEHLTEKSFLEGIKEAFYSYIPTRHGGELKGQYRRKDMDLATREKLGQIFRADAVIPATIKAQEDQITKGLFYKQVAEDFASVEKLDGYVQVPNDTSFGLLAGKYVPKQVHYSLVVAPKRLQGFSGAYQKLYTHFKVNKTVKNPGTHLYNAAANIELMILARVNPAHAMRGNWKELVKLGEKYGMVDDTNLMFNLGEIVKKVPNGHKNDKAFMTVMKRVLKEAYMAQDSKLGKAMRSAYNWEDKFFKLLSFSDEIYKIKKAKYEAMHGELPVVHSKHKAIDAIKLTSDEEYKAFAKANALFVDYARPLPPLLDKINRYTVPFANYGFKSTPVVARLMIQNPLTAMALNVAGGGIAGRVAALGAGVMGFDTLKEWIEKLEAGDTDKTAHETWMKPELFGKEIPYDNMLFAPNWRKISEDDKSVWYLNQGRMFQGMRTDFLTSLKSGGMIGQIAGYGSGTDAKTGRKFIRKDDSNTKATYKTFKKVAKDFLPSTWGNVAGKAYDAYRYGENLYGERLSLGDVAWQMVGVRRVDKEKAEIKASRELKVKISKATNEKERKRAVLREAKKWGHSQRLVDEKFKEIEEEVKEAKEDLADNIKKAKKIEGWDKGVNSFGKTFSKVKKAGLYRYL